MIKLLYLVALLNATSVDPCAELCAHDGPSICSGGSWNKNGLCHRYVFRGDPELMDYCYHTAETAATCPSNGRPVRVTDVARILASGSAETTTTTSTTEAEEDEDLEGLDIVLDIVLPVIGAYGY
jgi:hypothetical protein